MKRRNEKKLPRVVYVLIGVSIMFVIFRGIFLAEFGIEMDVLSIFIPGLTMGVLYGHWLSK